MKKILCVLLSVCMLAAYVPSVSAIVRDTEGGMEKKELAAYLKDGTLPEGAQVFVEEKFDTYTNKVKVGKWDEVVGDGFLRLLEEDGYSYVQSYCTDDKDHGPRMAKKLNFEGLETFWIEAEFRSLYKNWRIAIRDEQNNVNFFEPYSTEGKWVNVKVFVDLSSATAKVYIDGEFKEDVPLDKVDLTSESLVIRVTLNTNGKENADCRYVRMFTTDEFEGLLIGIDGKLNLANAKATNPTGYTKVMRDTHPRVMVTDWDEIREKIDTVPICAKWYGQLKDRADGWLTVPPVEYGNNARNNANDASQNVRNRLVTYAFVAAVSGEAKYKNQAMAEMRNVRDKWPDWGENGAYLIAAQIILAHSLCYDWMYDMLTDSEKAEICAMMETRGFTLMVTAYEGRLATGNALWAEHNQNMVGNASNAIAAIAFGSEYPQLAEYILEKVAVNMPKCFVEVGADGSFCEPYEYWSFGMGHTIKCMAALESGLADGAALPKVLDFASTPGFDKCGDFPLYYMGEKEAFSYGATQAKNVPFGVMFYLAKKYNKPEYAQWYLDNQPAGNIGQGTYRSIAYAILFYDDAVAKQESQTLKLDKFFAGDGKYEANGMALRQSWDNERGLTAFMQGGDNEAFHNYRSLGNFVVDWAGERWFSTTGKDSASYSYNYETKVKSAGGKNEDIYWHRTEGNNCILINPDADAGQIKESKALLVRTDSNASGAYGILDMTPTFESISSAQRGMMLTAGRSRLIIQDEYKLQAPSEVYWFAHTGADVKLSADGTEALLEKNGKKMYVKLLKAPAGVGFEVMDVGPLPTSPQPANQQAEFKPDYTGDKKLALHMTNITEFDISVLMIPIEDGMEIPTDIEVYVPMKDWSLTEAAQTPTLGKSVALMLGNPVAYANGTKCYVDANNTAIVPFTENGRTLLPVRFISESFGAEVGWNESTQTVTVDYNGTKVLMQLGSTTMRVNGKEITLDVAPKTVGGRTMLPLRAMAEAVGKKVFWDDRGLIIIGDKDNYAAEEIEAALRKLDVRVFVGDSEVLGFAEDTLKYTLPMAKSGEIRVKSNLYPAEVMQGNPASIKLFGKTYTLSFAEDKFANILGTGDVAKEIVVTSSSMEKPKDYQTYMQVSDVASSTGWSKYPKNGTIDGIISDEMENRWTGEGEQWISYDLGSEKYIYSMSLATMKSASRYFVLGIDVSSDGTNWTTVYDETQTQMQPYATVFKLDTKARFVRINAVKSSDGIYNSYTEVRFYDSEQMQKDDMVYWKSYLKLTLCEGSAGENVQLTVLGVDKENKQYALDDKYTYTFVSADESIASVDANGVVTLKKVGTTKITVTVEVKALNIVRTAEIDVYVK